MMKKYISPLLRFCVGVLALVLLQLGANQFVQAQQTGADFDHSATGFVLTAPHQNVRCETCHVKGVFKGTPKTCDACHGWNNPIATTVMPANHIPTQNAPCESCHMSSMTQFNDALRVFSHVSVPAQSCMNCHDSRNPHPGVVVNPSDATHAKVQANNTPCGVCHTTLQFTGPKLPPTHIPTAAVACANCHVSTDFSVMPSITAIHANAPSSSTNCMQCHSTAGAASFAMPTLVPAIVAPPGNHIPMAGQSCEACHVGAGSSLQLPVVDGSKFTNSRFNHVGISTGCATCHGPGVNPAVFAGISNIVVMPDSSAPGPLSHIPGSTTCETCHSGSTPSGQINANATATVPGTGFQSPKPLKDMVHAGVTSNCASCHEAGMQWVGMQLYPLAGYVGFQTRPQLAAGTFNIANAFHPATGECSQCHVGISFDPVNTKKPANHIPTSAVCAACHKDRNGNYAVMPALSDIHANSQPGMTCVQCHSTANAAKYATVNLQIVAPPGTHIAMGASGCETCHVGSGSSMASTVVQDGDKFSGSLFSHTGISSGCDACHGASVTPTTFYGVSPVAISTLVPAHMPTTGACETCHTNRVPTVLTPATGVNFSGAQFSHTGIGSGCASCHGPTIVPSSFAGNPNIVVMPTTGAPGAVHIPSAVTCESCHLGSTPTGLVNGSATMVTGPGTKFQSPVPLPNTIHQYSDVSSCNVCHETGSNFIGMDQYTRTTTPYVPGSNVIYHGFQTRPNMTGGGYSIQDANHPGSTECSTCHVGYNGFGAPVPPAGHIPVSATASCSNCHSDTVNFATRVSLNNIHLYAQSRYTNCVQCHSVDNAKLYKLKYAAVPAITSPSSDHIPMGTAGCETCHAGPGSSMASPPVVVDSSVFSGSLFSHSGINQPCSVCHGVNVTPTTYFGLPNIKVFVAGTGANAHMPVSGNLGCDTCHTTSTPTVLTPANGVSFAGSQFSHTGITADCANCHGPTITANSFKGGGDIVVMPPSAGPGPGSHIPTTSACENCHLAAKPAVLVNARAASLVGPGTGFQVSPPKSATIHANVVVGTCDVCHGNANEWIGMSLYPSVPPRTAARVSGTVYTGFQSRPGGGGTFAVPDTGHTTTNTCSNCHSGYNGFGPPTMPSTHIPVSATSSCANCHTDPSGDYSIPPATSNVHKYAPSSTTNCAQCHSAANALLYPMTPALKAADSTHMPMGGQACETCHVDSLTNLTTNNNPTFAGSKFSHAGAGTGCAACHATSVAGTFQGANNTNIIAVASGAGSTAGPTVHLPFTTSCETCHTNNTPTTLLPAVATNALGNTGFASPAPASAGIHTGATTCNVCHDVGSTGVVSDVWMGMSYYPAQPSPYKGFQTRPSTTATTATTFRMADAIHPTGGDCSSCHVGFIDFSAAALPQYHIPTKVVPCANCHLNGSYTTPPALTDIHANAQSSTGNCVQCHSTANAAIYNQLVGITNRIVAPHTNHIPMGNLGCESCHVSATPVSSIAGAVLNGANFKNSAYSHSGVTSGCDTCHGNLVTRNTSTPFTGPSGQVLTPVYMPANHVPNDGSAGCETCHTTVPSVLVPFAGNQGTGTTFKTDKLYSHKGITTACSNCHNGSPSFIGITNLVMLPSTTGPNGHIPSSSAIPASTCEACHTKNIPSASVSVAPATPKGLTATGFYSPAPTGAMIHNGVTSGCGTCHENPNAWLGVGLYARTANTGVNPTTPGSSYVGFQTRPSPTPAVYGQYDTKHPASTAVDCSVCHGSTTSFTVSAMPSNHIPISSTATCDACHRNISLVNGNADFSQTPGIADIHLNIPSKTVNCAQCHSDANALIYNNSKSVPPLVIKSPSGASPTAPHVPFGSTACEVCHVFTGAIANTSKFNNGKYSHTGVTTGCATCHGGGLAPNYYAGITNLVAIPAGPATQGSTSHIPYGTTGCEVCHAGSTPTTLSAVTGTPASTTGFRLPAPTGVMIHGNITSGCNTCHDTNYLWKGVDLYPINPKVITAGANYNGFQTRPVGTPTTSYGITDGAHPASGDCSQCHTSTTVFTAVAKPAGHMPTTTSTCSTCHSTTDYSIAGLGSLTSLHTGITAGMVTYTATTIGTKVCVTCHVAGTGGTSGTAPFVGCASASDTTNCPVGSPPKLSTYQPTVKEAKGTHVPIGTLDCNGCHAAVTPNFVLTSMMKNQTMHDNAKLGGVLCKDCHEYNLSWYGVTGLKTRTPSKHTTAARMAPNNCANSGCHDKTTVSGGFRMLLQPVMRGAQVSPEVGRVLPMMPSGVAPIRGSLGNAYDHKDVQSGQCKTCHDGKSASGMPARHLMVNTSCDVCHRTTSWLPAQFSHNGVSPNTCLACHNGISASAKPPGHFMTARSCDSCHKTIGWTPVQYQHVSPQYQPSPTLLSCTGCHITNGEIIPRQMRGQNRVKPIPVGP